MRRIVTDVPEAEVASVEEMMRANGATVTAERQPNGRFTIVGDFPPRGAPAPPAPAPGGPAPADDAAAVDVLARTLWGEARGERTAGREAVAAVVMNRVRSGRFAATVAGVCRQPAQFSCWNDDDPNRPLLDRLGPETPGFAECVTIATRAVRGELADPTGGALHYHTLAARPGWSVGKVPCCTIGGHHFFDDVA